MRWFGLCVTSLLLLVSVPASAQTFGAPVPGMCLLSRTGAIGASRAGQSMQAQLRTAIDRDRRALEGRQSAIAPIEFQRQLGVLNQQAQAFEQQQNARFIAAQTRGQQQIDRALNEALSRVITRNACGVVMERDHAYGWNNAMDITSAAAREMDGILQNVALQ